MKSIRRAMAAWLIIQPVCTQAAIQEYPLKYRIPVIEPGITRYESHRTDFGFRMEILSDSEGLKPESGRRSRPFVTAQPGERYAIRLYNPLPVRAVVNLTVDGINTISGKPSGIEDGDKWLMEPYSYLTLRGWQVNGGESRRFFFTDKPKSYAKWRGEQMEKDLSANCGVIGAAFFWNKKELDDYWQDHPIYRYPAVSRNQLYQFRATKRAVPEEFAPADAARLRSAAPAPEKQLAGTGMGERESHPTTLVDFHYDTGMYKLSQALLIYYDFAQAEPVPNPFPAISYAPEMPYMGGEIQ